MANITATGQSKNVKIIGIIGAGQMGAGIAQVAAQAGFTVELVDIKEEFITRGIGVITKNLDRMISKGKLAEADKAATLARIKTSTEYSLFKDADLVIEAATENEALKKKIFETLCPVLRADALIATNTSSISIARLATYTDRPDKFMGMHFFNPVPAMALVEMIRGIATSENTLGVITDLVSRIGKTGVTAHDYPAFIVNRILLPMINEACYAIYEGVGSITDIDNGLKLGCNHPMGPLELADFIGLDTCLAIMQVIYNGMSDSKYRPCPLLVKYVEAGWYGRKSGRGFYDYSGEKPVPTR